MALTYIQKTVHPTPITLHESNGVAYFTFPLLEQTRMVRHAFSTRLGGASKGYFSTMNFSLTRGDNRDDVLENYRKMARILGTDVSKMVLSHQTHTTNIRLVTEADAGKGIWRERDYENIDGLITNVPGLTLVTFFADCVPLYFVDPVVRSDCRIPAGREPFTGWDRKRSRRWERRSARSRRICASASDRASAGTVMRSVRMWQTHLKKNLEQKSVRMIQHPVIPGMGNRFS